MDTRVIGIASGKGGVGKTTFSINLALQFAAMGKRVLLFDADLGMANIHIAFNKSITKSLANVIDGRATLEDIIVNVHENIDLISGGSGVERLADLNALESSAIVQSFSSLEGNYDYMIVDMSAGITSQVIAFMASVQLKIIVGTDELSSISDAYGIIKVLSMKQILSDLVYIPNRVSSPITGKKLYESLNYVTNKFLNHDIEFIGSITEDPIYSRAWQADNPASIISKNTNASAEINKIAREIENHQVFNTPNNNSLQFFLTGIQVN